jgi:hypothetical protein
MKKERGFVIGLSIVHDGLLDPKLTFFTDEANLNLWGMLTHKTTGIGVVNILMP